MNNCYCDNTPGEVNITFSRCINNYFTLLSIHIVLNLPSRTDILNLIKFVTDARERDSRQHTSGRGIPSNNNGEGARMFAATSNEFNPATRYDLHIFLICINLKRILEIFAYYIVNIL